MLACIDSADSSLRISTISDVQTYSSEQKGVQRLPTLLVQEAAAEPGSALFANQFENLANFRAHLRTGREIWRQTCGRLHAFVSGAGTGGTIAGISCYLKSQNPRIQVRGTSFFGVGSVVSS